ncbi:MAG TPA: TonB-dependent receptor [Bryobacteraceae bacterium]|nr:TonB-dependent receptor [Bryobacteraceae bacterium]
MKNRWLLWAGCLLLAAPLAAQKITGTLSGAITDASGASIEGARVTVRNRDTGATREAVSNVRGGYEVEFLTPATYDVTIEHPGFKKQVFQGVVIQVNQSAELDASLEVGDVVQEVAVQASAPLLQTTESSVGSVIEFKQVQQLPLNGRQFLQLALLVPGATQSPPGGRQSTERGTLPSALNVNGNREGSNLFLIDGTLNTDPNFNTFVISPNIDSILEFKVQTNSYSPEFGQQAGAQINLVTRSGTNRYHGSAYEFLRNSSLDAKNLFDRPAPAKIPPFRQNQFGGTLGGPVKKDKLFFFGSYEGFRQVKAQTATAVVPSAALRQGDFSGRLTAAGQLTPIFDPLSTRANPAFNSALPASPTNPQYLRDPFPGNIIPTGRLDPIAQGILKYVDLPNLAALPLGVGTFLNNASQIESNDQFGVRVDYSLSTKDQIFGRYSKSDESIFVPGGLSSQGLRREPSPQIVTLGDTHFFSPAIANDFRLGFTRLRLNIVNKNAFTQNIPEQLGIQGQQGLPPSAWEVPNVAFAADGISTFGGANFGVPTVTRDNAYQIQESLSITKGEHSLRMGMQITRFQLNNATLNYILPSYTYRATPLTADVTNPNGISRGSEFADFLLGYSHNNQVTDGSGQVYLRRTNLGPWFEDTWRATRNLTLTLGLRWDFIPPWVEKYDRFGSVYVPALNGPAKPVPVQANVNVPGYGQVPRGVVNTNYNNWAPRVGLAYRLPKGTVVRAAYGIFYDSQIGNTTVDLVRNPPFQTRLIIDMPDSIFPTLTLRDLRPPGVTVSSSYFAEGQAQNGQISFPTAYVQQWNFSLQHEIASNWAVTGSYVGSTGRHLSFSGIANIPYPGPGPLNPRRPFNPDFTAIFQMAMPRVNSYYNSLQLKSEMRDFHGLTMVTAYTYSRSIDTGQEIRGGAVGNTQEIDNWNLDGQNRGRSAFDQDHRLVNSFVYDLPFGRGKKYLSQGGPLALLVGDWQANSIVTASTGLPMTLYTGVDTANSGVASLIHPDSVLGVSRIPAQQTANQWFNPAAFTLAPDCRNQAVYNTLQNPLVCFGNAGRNILSGPGLVNFDFALMKTFRLGETSSLQFRSEFFNLWNTPPLGFPTNILTSPTVGRILSAGAARQIQFALRASF